MISKLPPALRLRAFPCSAAGAQPGTESVPTVNLWNGGGALPPCVLEGR